MKKLLAPILAACLMVGGETALAENWIPFQDSDTTLVDTDSYVDSGLRSSLSIKSKAKEGDTISNIEFDKNHRTYRVTEMKTLDAKGTVTNDFTYSDDPQNWSALVPHSFGMNLYSHYVENPLPRFTNPQWLVIYKEEGVRFHGSTYDVEKNTISYKDGYATFWIRISYPWKDQNFSSVIYQVRMKIQVFLVVRSSFFARQIPLVFYSSLDWEISEQEKSSRDPPKESTLGKEMKS